MTVRTASPAHILIACTDSILSKTNVLNERQFLQFGTYCLFLCLSLFRCLILIDRINKEFKKNSHPVSDCSFLLLCIRRKLPVVTSAGIRKSRKLSISDSSGIFDHTGFFRAYFTIRSSTLSTSLSLPVFTSSSV